MKFRDPFIFCFFFFWLCFWNIVSKRVTVDVSNHQTEICVHCFRFLFFSSFSLFEYHIDSEKVFSNVVSTLHLYLSKVYPSLISDPYASLSDVKLNLAERDRYRFLIFFRRKFFKRKIRIFGSRFRHR